jgi:hypothetical protein
VSCLPCSQIIGVVLKTRGSFLAVADVGCSSHFSLLCKCKKTTQGLFIGIDVFVTCGLIYLLLAHAMRRAPIVVQFYLVVVVAVAGTFFCGAAGAGLTAGVAGFGLFATTGAV